MSSFQIFFNESFASLYFLGVERVYLGDFWSECGLKVNGVILGLLWEEGIVGDFGKDILKVFASL